MQLEFFEVPSPCVGVCQSDEKGYCLGCMRTRDERLNWISLTSDNKQKVIKRCQQRKKRKNAPEKIKVVEQEVLALQPSLLDPPNNIKTKANTNVELDAAADLDFGDFEL